MKYATTPIALLSVSILLTSLSQASVVGLWDSTLNDYSTSNVVYGATVQNDLDLGLGVAGADDHREVMAFGAFPAPEAGVNNGPAFFGGFYAASSEPIGTPSNTSFAIILRNNPDELRLQNTWSGATERTWRSVVYLPTPASLPLDGAILTLGTGAASGVDHHFHYVVRSEGKFYVSNDFFTVNGATQPAAGTYNANSLVVDTSTTLWQEWDFTINSGNNFNVAFSTTATLPENATADAVGFFLRGDTSGNATSIQTNLRFIGYQAIPEPGLLAGLAGGAVLAVALFRRSRATGSVSTEWIR